VRQFFAILGVNLAGVGQRLGAVLTIVVGVTCAVGVLVSMLAIVTGARHQELADARADRVIFSKTGARGLMSNISKDEAATARELPGIRKNANGEPIVVLQSWVPFQARRRITGTRIYFLLTGISGDFSSYTPEFRLTEGRMFRRGLHELIAGNTCVRQFTGFEIGAGRPVHGVDWPIVGHFDQGHDQQCAVYTDAEVLMSTFGGTSYQRVTAMLESPGAFEGLRAAVQSDPTLHLEVKTERDELEQDFKPLNGLLNFVSYFVGTIMAIGATLGAVNSLYAIVDARRREFATLRAIGFGAVPITVSVLCESILLALPGAALGGALAWLFFNGLAASPFGFSFNLEVTPHLISIGIVWALVMGVVGGVLPSLRAGRVPVTTALRAI
jgi:putative ABC transport system permease protein